MKRTTVKLPDDLDRAIRDEAARRGLTLSDWTREALEAHLPHQRGRRKLNAVAAGNSGHTDTSERFEEILAELLNADRERGQASGA
ncbi:ribbon-helix-helix protein, CopG family [Pseudonocardia sp. CA-107938]|uniref:ribbon-helix-helix protein, CopG family n=1 Tax=Pseudonocardia sp. CA-107938 TaxID=3240021 RepID=UPI003D92D8C9